MTRIGIDATSWANGRGYGRFIRELLPPLVRLAPDIEFLCFLDARAAERFDLVAPNIQQVIVPQSISPTEAAAADSSRSPGDMLRFSRAVARANLDGFFSPTVYTYFPLPPGLPAVVTVMDAIAERFPELTLPSRRARIFWGAKVWLALRQARLVLTISDYAAREIAEVHRLSSARIRIATLAPADIYRQPTDPDAIRKAAAQIGLPPDARWFVYVGGFSPHKNVDVLVRAHARDAAVRGDPAHLVLVGALSGDVFHGSMRDIREAIETGGSGHLVHFPGFVADPVLRDLLAGALAVVLPSSSEGFGLPPVEGAAAGAPVIATTASPLPELLPGGGLFVPPLDEGALAAALGTMQDDAPARQRMASAAREGALTLTWEASARTTLAALREVVA